ncbi:MAG: hypothetical protein KC496_07000, partial [Anaerolineae bacterium]|nr:hypothetical protein [Anaerolineae bacterium]
RIRDLYDAMTVLAGFGLLAAAFIAPEETLREFPARLAFWGLGGYALLGLEMFGLWLVLTAGNRPLYHYRLIAVAAWIGFYWGVWMRWQPELRGFFPAVDLLTMFAIVGGFALLSLILYAIFLRTGKSIQPESLKLSLTEWLFLALPFALLFLYHALQNRYPLGALAFVVAMLVVCWSILWFRREDQGKTLLDEHIPPTPLNPLWIALASAVFVGATLFSYSLPLVGFGEFHQLWLMEIGFFALGILWLPLVAVVIAMRGIDYLLRSGQAS